MTRAPPRSAAGGGEGSQPRVDVDKGAAAPPKPVTLGDRVAQLGHHAPGFDYLRLVLASGVAASHVPVIAYGAAGIETATALPYRPFVLALLPMFFALAGFLVAASFERCNTISAWVGLRIIRIFPALAAATVLAALVIGPLFTVRPLGDYFADPEFRRHFLNMAGQVEMELPGLFQANPFPGVVNGQLWSIPYELLCYAGLAGLVLIGGRSRRWIVPAFALASMLAFAALHLWRQGDPTLLSIEYGPRRGLFISWAFLWGASLYLYRGQVPWTRGAFGLAALVAAAAHLFEGHVTYLGPISIAYVTVYLGLAKVPSFPRLRAVDISYGLYLHHWLAMQTVMLFAPPGWRSAAFLGLPAAFALAGLSWFFVEKPAQRLRGPLLAADRRNGGTPLALSVFVAAALLGFVASFNLYPFLY